VIQHPPPSSWPGSSRPSTPIPSRWRFGLDTAARGGWVYILTNRPNGILYIGVTANLPRRIWEHHEGIVPGFTKKYSLKILLYVEHYDDIRLAIQREKNLKHWPRAWKVRLILDTNRGWSDLYDQLV
jgi:putative endonuclease